MVNIVKNAMIHARPVIKQAISMLVLNVKMGSTNTQTINAWPVSKKMEYL